MSSKRLHYSDEKWLDLISECRSSGLSDKDWCMEHQIGISTFYYHAVSYTHLTLPTILLV